MARSAPSGIKITELNIANIAQDSTQVFIQAENVKGTAMTGTVNVDVIVMGVVL
ncbi:hypothetical protein [Staphylococcus warneri]|uniref:hypothetical protein n=1 Tax=Staphylococcus warneri TaxID=1292 RepID=UPI003B9EF272